MEVTLKKLAKCVFKSGRQALVKEMLDEELNREKILGYVSDAVAYGINFGINKIPQDRIGTMHTSLACARTAVGYLVEVTDPGSEEGSRISPGEAGTMCTALSGLTEGVFTEGTVKALHEKILSKVP